MVGLLWCVAASATDTPLMGGRLARFKAGSSAASSTAQVKFLKELALAGPLPSPLCPASSNVHLVADFTDVSLPLDCNRWVAKGSGYRYVDRDGVSGVREILFAPGTSGGKLLVRLAGAPYGSNAVSGTVSFVEASFTIGSSPYCGRFVASPVTLTQTGSGDLSIKGPSVACLGAAAGTAAATITPEPSATRTPTRTRQRTPSLTPTPTATPIWTFVPTWSAPEPSPEPLSASCAAPNSDVPAAANKVGAQTLRWLRDWATCLGRSGYAGPACDVRLDWGANYYPVLRKTGIPLPNELVCDESRCTQDLGRSLDHCQEKFTYENRCTLDDWDKVWRWVGDPPLPISGKCSVSISRDCLADADCDGGETCVRPSSCDIYKYAPAAWEPCRCIQEVFIKPQIDEWLANVRAMSPAPTSACAAAAFNTMGEAIGPLIESGCPDPADHDCVAAANECEAQWASLAVKASCGTCSLGPNNSCPPECPGAQIPCATWMSWCASAKARFDPLRRGTRQLPGGL